MLLSFQKDAYAVSDLVWGGEVKTLDGDPYGLAAPCDPHAGRDGDEGPHGGARRTVATDKKCCGAGTLLK